jgi:hypothetical protein
MPFGLTYASTVFQHMMNNIFREYLDHFVVIYLDDILIYSKNKEEHEHHIRLILKKLRKRGLMPSRINAFPLINGRVFGLYCSR